MAADLLRGEVGPCGEETAGECGAPCRKRGREEGGVVEGNTSRDGGIGSE